MIPILSWILFKDEISINLLKSLEIRQTNKTMLMTLMLCLLLMFHIPYYFLNMKENLLVMLDEIIFRS